MNKLTKKQWKEIEKLLQRKDRNLSAIARHYHISRTALYSYAWNRGWLNKKEQSILSKVSTWIYSKFH